MAENSDSDWDEWAENILGVARAESLGPEDFEKLGNGRAFRQQLWEHASALGDAQEAEQRIEITGSEAPSISDTNCLSIHPPLDTADAGVDKEESAWVDAMTLQTAQQQSFFKDEEHPAWRHVARIARSYSVLPVKSWAEYRALVTFLHSQSPRGDYLLCSLSHVHFANGKWFLLLREKEVRGVALTGGLYVEEGGQHLSIFTQDDDQEQEACHLMDSIFEARWTSIMLFAQSARARAHLQQDLHYNRGWRLQWEHPCYLYVLPPSVQLVNYHVGEPISHGLTLDWLRESDAHIIDEHWPYRSDHSLDLVTKLIQLGPCVGARTRDGSLACWIVLYDYGSIGMLHTLNEYRRKGIARAVVSAICTHLRVVRPDIPPFCHIITTNTKSCTLFESLGFVLSGTADWSMHMPPAPLDHGSRTS